MDKIYSKHLRIKKNRNTNIITESIEKVEKTSLNIHNSGQDIRITAEIEEAQKAPKEEKKKASVSLTRTKNRYSYYNEFMVFDLTQTKASNEKTPVYEIELEIKDVEYMKRYIDDPIAFKKLVLRFVRNLQSLYYILGTRYNQDFEKMVENSYIQTYGKDAPMPVVGGYLGCMAHRKGLYVKKTADISQ